MLPPLALLACFPLLPTPNLGNGIILVLQHLPRNPGQTQRNGAQISLQCPHKHEPYKPTKCMYHPNFRHPILSWPTHNLAPHGLAQVILKKHFAPRYIKFSGLCWPWCQVLGMRDIFHLIQKNLKLQNQSFPCLLCGLSKVRCTGLNETFMVSLSRSRFTTTLAMRRKPCSTSPTRLHGPIACKKDPHLRWGGTQLASCKQLMELQPTQHLPLWYLAKSMALPSPVKPHTLGMRWPRCQTSTTDCTCKTY